MDQSTFYVLLVQLCAIVLKLPRKMLFLRVSLLSGQTLTRTKRLYGNPEGTWVYKMLENKLQPTVDPFRSAHRAYSLQLWRWHLETVMLEPQPVKPATTQSRPAHPAPLMMCTIVREVCIVVRHLQFCFVGTLSSLQRLNIPLMQPFVWEKKRQVDVGVL